MTDGNVTAMGDNTKVSPRGYRKVTARGDMLKLKHQRFVSEYVIDFNGTQAAIRAGYSPRSASSIAERLLRKDEIRAALDALARRAEINAERVLQERASIAFFNPKDLFTADGRLKKPSELDGHVAAAIAGLDVESHDSGAVTVKYRFADKNASLTALEKHLGLYKSDQPPGSALNMHIHLGDDIYPSSSKRIFDLFKPTATEKP